VGDGDEEGGLDGGEENTHSQKERMTRELEKA
jgi:hypothetical protein